MKNIITDDMVLGYRDYAIDRKTKKDFMTLDSVVHWICDQTLRYTETTKEFYDFAEQEYGIQKIVDRILDPNSPFDYEVPFTKEDIYNIFENRDKFMHASDFE